MPSTAAPPFRGADSTSASALPPLRSWIAPLVAAAVVRAVWLVPSWETWFRCDEHSYLYLARAWSETRTYSGQWPPLFPFLLAHASEALGSLFGPGAFDLSSAKGAGGLRACMSLLSVWTGAWVMAFAGLAGGRRACVVAGWTWALYLPLVPFAHVLLSEGLQLAVLMPSLVVLMLARRRMSPVDARVEATAGAVAAGLLLGLACLVREASLIWLVTCSLWAAWNLGRWRGGIVAVSGLLVIAPWSISASRATNSFQLLGQTLGVNAYLGWNALYSNFDLAGLDVPQGGVPGASARAALLEPGEGVEPWHTEPTVSYVERSRVSWDHGVAFIAEHPWFFLRTRVVKAADLASPVNYMARCVASSAPDVRAGRALESGGYGAALPAGVVRVVVTALSMALVVLVSCLAIHGVTLYRLDPGAASLVVAGVLATAPLTVLVTMSRFRAPLEALFVSAAAVALARMIERSPRAPGRGRRLGHVAALTVCLGLWYLSVPAVVAMVERSAS